MYYVIRFRLYPTEEQLILFYKTSGCCRWLYNKCKAHKDNVYKRTGENLDKSWFTLGITLEDVALS